MKLYAVLVLVAVLSVASGIKCYVCSTRNDCQKVDCPAGSDRCASTMVNGVPIKNCFASSGCRDPIKCCEGDLCNGAIPTGSSILLLLLSSAIMTVFL
ncbi:three-finger toxin MALT0070C-like [Takifugu flavidus]|uniref:three-finger toxin MALT0070C-like n=1 Tax=Takifugu flavidus TaxID=433684 RepID=UPI0025444842|nr:three-finger toxin MALT0070C-like [Takifugu flavidus]